MTTETQSDHVDPADEVRALVDGYRPTHNGNSQRLLGAFGDVMRYVEEWGKWIVYADGAWHLDHDESRSVELAKQTIQKMFIATISLVSDQRDRDAMLNWAMRSDAPSAWKSMVEAARGNARIRVSITQLNQHPELLNVANGTVDLRTGELLAHDPAHLLTDRLDVAYDPAATSPTWDRCLAEWQPSPEVRDYLREKLGSGATGYPTDEFDVHLGTGGNGKSRFLGQIEHVLGAYAVVPDKSLLTVQRSDKHDTVIARLFGARLAVASETSRNARLNEEFVKKYTSGDLLEARRMREDPWKFTPTGTLMIHTNYKPVIRGTDEGIWRRIRLVPWEASFLGDPDPLLGDKLRAESSGVLNWLVTGARAWLARGRQFETPEVIRRATAAYRAETDPIHGFVKELLDVDPEGWLPIGYAYETFLAWRTESRHDELPAMKAKAVFSSYMTERYGKGVTRKIQGTTSTVKCWQGVRLKPFVADWVEEVRALAPDRLDPSKQPLSVTQSAIFNPE